ncbi:MAG: hypothetical protein IT510_00100 [Sulfuritalea sp.]|jgi:hypothetical protein|nr:hypothetical protein [Sulfuritalea sp.]
MGILDWFKNRQEQFDPDHVSPEMMDWAVEKAVTVTNPKLKLLPDCRKLLEPAIETTARFLRPQLLSLPAAQLLAPGVWSADPVLRAFFVAPADIQQVLGDSDNLRELFDNHPEIDAAYAALGMRFKVQQVFGMALQGDTVRRDVAQTSASFSDHRARLCESDERRLRRAIGVEIFEYLLTQAMFRIGEYREERQDLQTSRSLMRSRLRLLQQHGPGLGSMLGEAPAAKSEQARLEAELLENERQMEALGGGDSVLEAELETLADVLGNPQRYIHFDSKRLRLSRMNLVVGEGSTEEAFDIDFAVAEVTGSTPTTRAFILVRVLRADLPPPKKLDIDDASRYL